MRLFRPVRRRGLVAAAAAALLGAGLGVPALLPHAAAATAPLGNLLPGETAALTGAIGSWQASDTQPLVPYLWSDGTASLAVTSAAAGDVVALTGSETVPALPGAIYQGSVRVRAAAASSQITAQLRWYTVTGSELTTDRVVGYTLGDGSWGWTNYAVSGIAPAGAAFVALAVDAPASGAGQTHYLSQPNLTASTGGSSAVRGPLTTVGNAIVDGNGQHIVLRGLNRSGQYDATQPGGLTRYDIGRIKAWGANVVRVTLGQQLWMPGCSTYDPAYKKAVDQDVQWITSYGMVAVLDLQWNDPTCDAAGLNPLADSGSLAFWTQVAARYKNNRLVAFDLFNEPHGVTAVQWRDGGTVTSVAGTTYQGVGMTALYNAVRRTGANNLVLMGVLNYASQWPSTAPLAGTKNVVYAVHAYNCDQPSACTSGTGASWLLDPFVTPGKTVPIMVSEFGWPTSNAPQSWGFNANVISEAEANGWSWAAWDWDRDGTCSTATWFNLISPGTCGPTGTYEPAVAGEPILSGLTRNS
ncbi:MAG TPA: glycoside hydrolase family 5 protein [Mycobacteriales bacterium]